MVQEPKNEAAEGDDTGRITPYERTEEIGAERAGLVFRARTGVEPTTDPVVLRVAAVAVAAALTKQVEALNEWIKPVRKAVRGEPPELLGWIKPTLQAAAPPPPSGENVPEPTLMLNFGSAAAIAPGKTLDLIPLTDRVSAFRDEVKKLAAVGQTLAEDLGQTVAELSTEQADEQGRRGAFIEARAPGKPRDEARWRFLIRLHRMWAQAGRGELGPTETGLLAVYLGVDDGHDGVNGVVKRWSDMIQKAKAGAAAREAGESFSSAPET